MQSFAVYPSNLFHTGEWKLESNAASSISLNMSCVVYYFQRINGLSLICMVRYCSVWVAQFSGRSSVVAVVIP
jgi:hypothetical protein